MKRLIKFVIKVILTFTLLYIIFLGICWSRYIKYTCDFNNWILKFPDEIQELVFWDIGYDYYKGDVIVFYKDKDGELYCWTTGIKDTRKKYYSYYNKLSIDQYVIAMKDGKKLGIFKVKD
jgi:hypothetical protein